MKTPAAAALVLTVVLTGAACGSGGGTPDDGAPASGDPGHRVSGPLLVAAPVGPDGASMTAAISGVVEKVGDCVTVGGGLVLWPHGSTWDEAAQTVTVPHGAGGGDDVVVRVGQRVEGGGGSWPLPPVGTAGFGEAVHERARACLGPDGQVTSFAPSAVHDAAPGPAADPAVGAAAVDAPRGVFSSGPILVRPQPDAGREQGLLRGVVQLVPAGDRSCLALDGAPIVFEHGATWDGATATARTAEGVVLTPGREVEGGGSSAAWSAVDRSRFTGEAAELVDACAGPQGRVVFFHPQVPPS